MKTIRTIFARLAAGLAFVYSAGAVAQAVENGDRPRRTDLLLLGIDPRAFTSLSHG